MKIARILWLIIPVQGTVLCLPAPAVTNSPSKTSSVLATNPPPERFDHRVRDDFFAGFKGDRPAFDRAMKCCEDTLAEHPKDAQAMVWQGSGWVYLAGQAFQSNNVAKGIELWTRGLKQMDAAVAVEPDNISVLIPRGATLLPVSKYTPDPAEAKALLKTGLADYEKVLQLQQPVYETLSTHSRGELLFGLADGWFRIGDTEKSRHYLNRIKRDCAGSEYAKRAEAWLATSDPGELRKKSNTLSCIGCHKD